MATTAPINPIESNGTGVWKNLTNGSTAMDTKPVLVSCISGEIRLEKLSSAEPTTSGVLLKMGEALPLFTKEASYDVWFIAQIGSVARIEVVE